MRIFYIALVGIVIAGAYFVLSAYRPENFAEGEWYSDHYNLTIENHAYWLYGSSGATLAWGRFEIISPGVAQVRLSNRPDVNFFPRVDYKLSLRKLSLTSGGESADFIRVGDPSWIVRIVESLRSGN